MKVILRHSKNYLEHCISRLKSTAINVEKKKLIKY